MIMACPEGWAHDPLMHTARCGTPVLAMKVMAVVALVLLANFSRLVLEFLWRMWRLSLHEKPLFAVYCFHLCISALYSSLYVAVVAQAGIQPFSSALVWCLGVGSLCQSIYMSIVALEESVGNTLALMFVLDPNMVAVWKQRIFKFAIGLRVAFVGCHAMMIAWWSSSDEGSRHKGAMLFAWGWFAIILAFFYVSVLVQRRQHALQAKMGQRSVEEMKTGLRVRKINSSMFPCFSFAFPVIAILPQARELLGTILLLGVFPFLTAGLTLGTFARCKKLRLQMAATSSRQIVPLNVRPATDSEQTIAAAVAQAVAQSKPHRPSVTVRESGVTLRFLEQFFAENQISEDATANDVVTQHVKPHTKDIGGHGSGPFVGLVQSGETSGVRWCGVPTHMVSYSWKYTLATMLDILRKFEKENPPAPGTSYRYYIDQFALDQWGFGKEKSEEETQAMMLETLNESIKVPGKMLCMLHPW
jgi:hypothetical protein